jgi:hypothetical protein
MDLILTHARWLAQIAIAAVVPGGWLLVVIYQYRRRRRRRLVQTEPTVSK